jgi:type IX secretion system PorP/SprF family membrane protein
MKKYIYKIIALMVLISCYTESKAQQDAMYTQYMFNSLAINPAYAGSRNVISSTLLHRNQWSGIDGAPRTTTFTIDAPIRDNKIGLGLQIFNDQLGISNNTGVVISSAYRIRMDKGTLSFGLQGGVSNFRANFTSVNNTDGGGIDPAFTENVNTLQFNFGTGIYYNSDKFFVGVSVPTLVPNRISKNTIANTNNPSRQEMHLFVTSGYVFDLNQDFKFKPSFLVKAVRGAPIEGDLNATIWIKEYLGLGVQYRTNADVSGLLEVQISQQLRFGYAYDYSVTKLRNFNSGGHEVMLRYEFGFEKDKVVSPRFF